MGAPRWKLVVLFQQLGGFFTLANGEPVPCADVAAWSQWMETHNRTLVVTEIEGVRVSTAFLGMSFHVPPLLFETMVFGGYLDKEQVRRATVEQAMESHALTCRLVWPNRMFAVPAPVLGGKVPLILTEGSL